MNDPTRLLLVGVGPHARRFYLPTIAALGPARGIQFVAAVELHQQKEPATRAIADAGLDAELLTVSPFSEAMPDEAAARLDELIARLDIGAVIISTDPLSHGAYAQWAIERQLHVLLDKPISSRRDAVSDLAQARGIEDDYHLLARAYRDLLRREARAFIVCAHRRYHPGIQAVVERIEAVSRQTGCPVTAIHSHHSDGQWRLPNEMVTQKHHSYCEGHGKASHSGHHFFDCVYRFQRAGQAAGKAPDQMQVFASFVQPHGHLRQLTERDYERLFGPEYLDVRTLTDAELDPLLSTYGELDISAVLTFRAQGVPVCLGSLELLHNGFSRRSWVHPGEDLYKGNGRVKHEHHRVHVGPFMAIHVDSYQAKDKHERSDEEDLLPGGNNHYDLRVFNNTDMLPGTEAVEQMSLTDLGRFKEDRLHIEVVKEGAVREFFACLTGALAPTAVRSSLLDHRVPVQILSGVYRSHVQALMGQEPTVTFDLDNGGDHDA